MSKRDIKSMAVFCGSNFGATDAFAEGARSLGTTLAQSGITLIYGGTAKGLMGVVASLPLCLFNL